MKNKFEINTLKGKYNVFTGEGFYKTQCVTGALHLHYNSEIHVVMGASSEFLVDNRKVTVPADSVMIVPAGVLHCCLNRGQNAYHCAFQTDYVIDTYGVYNMDYNLIRMLFNNVETIGTDRDYTVISMCIALILALVDRKYSIQLQSVDDNAFLMERFFTEKYAEDVTLNDLAEILNVSDRQTERLVIACTGLPFRKKLCSVRMEMAKELMKDSRLSLNEIANRVGYKSYAGFWKAYKKHNE